jgi:hypothetical protein
VQTAVPHLSEHSTSRHGPVAPVRQWQNAWATNGACPRGSKSKGPAGHRLAVLDENIEISRAPRRATNISFRDLNIMRALATTLPIAFALLAGSAAAQSIIARDQPTIVGTPLGPTIMWVVPYRSEVHGPPDVAPGAAYSCYRIGRCSAYDLYRFRDHPNRLTRLAPAAPRESGMEMPSMPFLRYLVPVTPDENITPQFRAASQVRDEYRAVGRPIDRPK